MAFFIIALSGSYAPKKSAFAFGLIGYYLAVGYKKGKWVSVGWWEKKLIDLPQVPKEIVPFPNLKVPMENFTDY